MEIREKVLTIISQCLELPIENLRPELSMDDIENWDSMRNVMILSRLEEDFDIMIPEDDIFDMITIGDIIAEMEKILI